MRQIPLALGPEPRPTFATFLPDAGGASAAALEHLRTLAMPAAPVYLWGPTGAGKTHLLRGLVDAVESAGQGAAWFEPGTALPWTLAPGRSLVVIDRCDELDAAAQQAAFALFVEAAVEGVQVAAAGRWPPVDLPLRDDLRTRLGWGHVFALEAPDEAQTRIALRNEADRRGIELSDEVINHVLARFPRDLKHLMALLDRLDGYAMSTKRPVTVPLLRSMMLEEAS